MTNRGSTKLIKILAIFAVCALALTFMSLSSSAQTWTQVSTFAQLQAALENPTTTHVMFTNDITIQKGKKGIQINQNKPMLVVDGGGYILQEAQSIDLNDTIRFKKDNKGILKNITWQNMNIVGQNHRGFAVIETTCLIDDVVVTFDNVKYVGPQLIKAKRSTVIIRDSDVVIMNGFNKCIGEVAEATHVRLEGNVNIDKKAPGSCRELFFITGDNGGFSVASGADVYISNDFEEKHKSTGLISYVCCKNTYMIFEDDSKFFYKGNNYVHKCNGLDLFYVGKRAEVVMFCYGDFYCSYSMIIINKVGIVDEGAKFWLIAPDNRKNPPNLQLRQKATMTFNSPKDVFIYNRSTEKCNGGLAMGPHGCDVNVFYNNIESLEYWIFNTAPYTNLPAPTYDWRNPDSSQYNSSPFTAFVNMKCSTMKDFGIWNYYGAVPYDNKTATLKDVNVIRIGGGSPTMYTVSFEANGGTPVPPPQSLPYGALVVEPQGVTRTGYALGGWFRNANFSGNPWNFSIDRVTGNMVLYAQWRIGPPTRVADLPGDRKTALLWANPLDVDVAVYQIRMDNGPWVTYNKTDLYFDAKDDRWYYLFTGLTNYQEYTFQIRGLDVTGLPGVPFEIKSTPDPIGEMYGRDYDLISIVNVNVRPATGWPMAEGNTIAAPYKETIIIPPTLATADIHVNSIRLGLDATLVMYSDPGFTNVIQEFHRMDVNGAWLPEMHVYFKVTSGNQQIVKYYDITIRPN